MDVENTSRAAGNYVVACGACVVTVPASMRCLRQRRHLLTMVLSGYAAAHSGTGFLDCTSVSIFTLLQ